MKQTVAALSVVLVMLLAAPTQAKSGFYIGVGLGGAVVDGERGVAVPPTSGNLTLQIKPGDAGYDDLVRTDMGGGLSVLFRMGYNILGAVAIEMAFIGHGANLGQHEMEGVGHLDFDAVIHPLGIAELAGEMEETIWDPYVLIGGGFTYAGYRSAVDDDTKGWFGPEIQTGFGLNVHLVSFFSLGADFRFTLPMYDKWYFNFDKDQSFEPLDTPSTLVFTPMVLGTFHF